MLQVLDIIAIVSAIAASAFWLAASQGSLRRIRKLEELDQADINRLVVAFNRSQILNARAALATGISALTFALRYLFALANWA